MYGAPVPPEAGEAPPAPEEPRAECVPCPALSCSCVVDLTPLVLNPGGFQFSYLARNNVHNLHCPGFPW